MAQKLDDGELVKFIRVFMNSVHKPFSDRRWSFEFGDLFFRLLQL